MSPRIYQYTGKLLSIITAVTLVVVLLSCNFVLKYPLKSTEDIWQYVASIHELRHDFQNINDPYFPSGPKDIHYGPYLVAAGDISRVFDIQPVTLYLEFGVLMPLFIICALYAFYRSIYPAESKTRAYFFTLFAMLCWGASSLSYSGYFSFADLLLGGAAPANFAFGSAVLAVAFLTRQGVGIIARFVIFFVLTLVTFVTHPLTGIMLFLVLAVFLLARLIKERHLTFEMVMYGLIPAVCFLLAMMWPYYSVYDFFFHKTTFVNTAGADTPFTVSQWLPTGGLGFLGILYILKIRNLFLVLWVVSFVGVLVSYLTPFHVSLYWRFLPLLLVPCFAVLYHEVTAQSVKKKSIPLLLIIFLFFGLISEYSKFDYRASWKSYTTADWPQLQNHTTSDVLLSDPFTGYIASGLYGINIVAVRDSHQNPANQQASTIRKHDLDRFFESPMGQEEIESFVKRYGITYVLVNNEIKNTYDWHSNDETISRLGTEISDTGDTTLYRLGTAKQ